MRNNTLCLHKSKLLLHIDFVSYVKITTLHKQNTVFITNNDVSSDFSKHQSIPILLSVLVSVLVSVIYNYTSI